MSVSDLGARLRCAVDVTLETLLLDGAVPWELDEALEARGWSRGVCMTLDREGLDVGHVRRRAFGIGPLAVLDRMNAEGRLGPKVGVGFYRYPGGGGAVIDPLIDDLIAEEAHFARLQRAPLDEDVAAARLSDKLDEMRRTWITQGICTKEGFSRELDQTFSAPLP